MLKKYWTKNKLFWNALLDTPYHSDVEQLIINGKKTKPCQYCFAKMEFYPNAHNLKVKMLFDSGRIV